jgi:hypothetical protein
MKKTVTILERKRKIMLFRLPELGSVTEQQPGNGLTILADGDILYMPFELDDPKAECRFADGCAPGDIAVATAPSCLLRPTKGTDEQRSKDETKANLGARCKTSQQGMTLEYGEVRLDDVLIPYGHDDPDDDDEVVSSIAESQTGPFHPILVRRIPDEDGKVTLIAGIRRFRGALIRGMRTIKCIFFAGSETAARIARLEEDLFRKNETVLRRSERLAEWAELIEKKGYRISGQVVRKRRGRPPKWFLKRAQELPAYGRTVEARRKILERGCKIAGISLEAKEVAKAGNLDNNQDALLAIANAGGTEAQVRKAKQLASKPHEPMKETTKASPARVLDRKRKRNGAHEAPPLQPDLDQQSEASEKDEGGGKEHASLHVPEDTSFQALLAMWKAGGGPKLWKYAPFAVRMDFLERLR